ncbi:hypothetical protein AMIS_41030 [Actinoplanes missouriensis 431]|uniref:Uncharacterized protein n=2 Tax=Actinoplanes missouriensis TaxID=1866 RepID=I0H8I6_ACTM4|nr:hypothetical protein AMIS_41030 [Actinoplanes missouriensis 431]
MLWRDVFVPDHVVASDGFTAEVGGMVEMPLALFCRFRSQVSKDGDHRPSVTSTPGDHTHPDNRSVYDLVGQAVAIESTVWSAGWMLDVDGLGIYVSEADAGPPPGLPTSGVYREGASDPAAPVPEPGTWTRVRGQLSIAEPYETGAYEPEADLLRHAVRTWLVRRAVRLDGKPGKGRLIQGRGQDAAVIQYADLRYNAAWTTVGYLLDLEQVHRE